MFFLLKGGGGGDQQQKAKERQEQVMDMKNSILSQVLSQEARARCNYFFFLSFLLFPSIGLGSRRDGGK